MKAFPPHARGWTPGARTGHRCAPVSPARAGMDRTQKDGKTGCAGFPRTRGDGPLGSGHGTGFGQFPPHARGWTRTARLSATKLSVSPARAGMDRRAAIVASRGIRFPRTRGDGPSPRNRNGTPTPFPSHARGWTGGTQAPRHGADVSPARAGMDLSLFPAIPRRQGFPRTRGDGPQLVPRDPASPRFPPHARGWTLDGDAQNPTWCLRFPRTRGDGPGQALQLTATITFPPHARGWTFMGTRHTERGKVSPARAGMDP